MNSEALKKTAHLFCKDHLHARLTRIHGEINKITEALQTETKSSAGDKHETGRAMLQLEREKLGTRLAEVENMNRVFSKVPTHKTGVKIGLGSFFQTDKHFYYVAISAGVCEIEDYKVFCVSTQTPIGKAALGKSEGENFVINGISQHIIKIV